MAIQDVRTPAYENVPIGSGEIEVAVYGEDDADFNPLVLIPGLGMSHEHWGELPSALGGRVLALDHPPPNYYRTILPWERMHR